MESYFHLAIKRQFLLKCKTTWHWAKYFYSYFCFLATNLPSFPLHIKHQCLVIKKSLVVKSIFKACVLTISQINCARDKEAVGEGVELSLSLERSLARRLRLETCCSLRWRSCSFSCWFCCCSRRRSFSASSCCCFMAWSSCCSCSTSRRESQWGENNVEEKLSSILLQSTAP